MVEMNKNIHTTYLASRGQGKTWLTAVFCVERCILYPGTQICVASKTLKQAKEVLKKICSDLMPKSAALRQEIKNTSLNGPEACIDFENGSRIFITTANDTARGARCHILICDEYRLISKNIIDDVLTNFMRAERPAGFQDKPEYEGVTTERNRDIYMSSVWFKSHWSYKHAQDYVVDMFNPSKRTFICGLPYQLSIKENLLNRVQIEEEMSKSTFNDISFSMESECLWFGENDNSFFKYDDLLSARKLKMALYPRDVYSRISNKLVKYIEKQPGEIRLLSADIAVMSSRRNKNDATAIFVT